MDQDLQDRESELRQQIQARMELPGRPPEL